MSKKRVCSLLLIFALVLASFNVNLVEANAAAKPNIKRVTLVSSVTTSVSWNKVSGASKYEVYCAKNDGNFKRVKTTKGTSCSFKKLDLGTKYSYKIRAIVKGKKGAFSNTKSITTKDWAYLLDVEEPYKTPYRYNTDPFTIAGERFNHGFTYYNLNKQDAYFNFKGKYSKMTFCVGCACEANSDVNKFGSLIRFFADDSELDETVYIGLFDLAKEYTVNLNYCNKLQMRLDVADYNGGTFGIGNIKVYK